LENKKRRKKRWQLRYSLVNYERKLLPMGRTRRGGCSTDERGKRLS
jgi:hypothetical protein